MIADETQEAAAPDDRPPHRHLISVMAIALLVALMALRALAWAPQADPRDFALGRQTKPLLSRYEGEQVLCAEDAIDSCMRAAEGRTVSRHILWLGNSQLYGVNQLGKGDETAVGLLAARLRPLDADLVGLSFPSASLGRHYATFLEAASRWRVDTLVVQLVLDDTRERYSADRPTRISVFERPGPDASTQERVEAGIVNSLQRCCRLTETRLLAQVRLTTETFHLRNALLGISAQSVRRILPPLYRENLAAFAKLLAEARKGGIEVIAYVAPLRDDIAPPYDPREYARFKQQTRAMAEASGARWIDLDRIVPSRWWGSKDATGVDGRPEIDFMHFQGEGHRIVADALFPLLAPAPAR